MNLFEQLNKIVTPQILSAVNAGEQGVASKILSVFYPILAAHLTKDGVGDRVAGVAQDENFGKNLLNAVLNDGETINQAASLQDKLAKEFNVPANDVANLLNTATPSTLEKIVEFANGNPIAEVVQNALKGFDGALPAWASAWLPAGVLAGGSTLFAGAKAANLTGESTQTVAPVATTESTSVTETVTSAVSDTAKVATGAVVGAAAAVTGAAAAAASTIGNKAGEAKDAAAAAVSSVGNKAAEVKDAAATHINTATTAVQTEKKGGFLKGLLPIIGLIIFGALAWLLLRSCQDKPAPVAAPTQSATADQAAAAAATPATFDLTLDEQGKAIASCDAKVGAEGVLASISTAVATAFGTEACKDLAVTAGHGESMPAAEHLPALFGLMKDVPNAGLSIADKVVRFTSSDEAATAKMIEGAKGILPADFTVEALNKSASEAQNLLPATLKVATDATGNALASCDSQVGDDALAGVVKQAVTSVFGADCQAQVANTHGTTLAIADKLPEVLGLLKGVPNAGVEIADKAVMFTGADSAAVAKLVEGAKAIVPADVTVEAQAPAAQPADAQDANAKPDTASLAAAGNDAAKQALNALGENATAEDVVKALNMQIINFATGSNNIPAANKEILDLAVTKLTALPNVALKITGHTDNRGSYESNKKLSESRAAAVRDYLVSKGIAADRLSTQGVSSDNPVASNDTEEGRFQNRRIEFSIQ